MTFQMYVVIQAVAMCIAYVGLTVGMPLAVFRKRWKVVRREEKLLFSFLFGNFYLMNLVFLLQLLHISNRVTLFLGTLVPWGYFVFRENRKGLADWWRLFVKNLKWLVGGQMGGRKLAQRSKATLRRKVGALRRALRFSFYGVIELLLFVGLLFALFYEYGFVILQNWGYHFSDSPVHNFWINALCDNDLFVAGIYPQGFHAVMYYLHTIFGFETYMLLNFFSLAQTLCLFGTALLVLRLICRNRFVPYIGMYFFLVADIWKEHVIMRFMGALPQEFGMIFILPAVYYGLGFFRTYAYQAGTDPEEEGPREKRFYYLAGFCMSFALTLMIHFYNTMILAFFCVAMAIGYFRLFVKKDCFLPIVKTCGLGLAIAIAPMLICFIFGTPLEPSLNWGVEVITGSVQKEESAAQPNMGGISEEEYSGGVWINEEFAEDEEHIRQELQEKLDEAHNKSVLQQYSERLIELPGLVLGALSRVYIGLAESAFYEKAGLMPAIIWGMLFLCVVTGLLRKLAGDIWYGDMLISVAVSVLFLSVLTASYKLGLPTLIPTMRAAMYLGFAMILLIAVCLDGLLTLIPVIPIQQGVSICMVPLLVGVILMGYGVREPYFPDLLSTNQAFACMTNILRTEEDFTWTICSADTELRMTQEHGYHAELLEFLHSMEQLDKDSLYEIPTEKVFFFIEKTPLDYTEPYYGSGQQVSKPGAAIALPVMDMGVRAYRGHSRWVCMSKLYYWMQEFRRLYPTNVRVYYEDRDFVCYEVTQEPYHLFNFAIDYGFNTSGEE